MSSQRKHLYLSAQLNEELTDRFRFFQAQLQLKAKNALTLMIIQSTDTLGYLEKKKRQEITPSPIVEEQSPPPQNKKPLE